jgi:hypothetical protein
MLGFECPSLLETIKTGMPWLSIRDTTVRRTKMAVNFFSWTPIGNDMDNQIGIGWIIRLQMNGIVMGTIHTRVHHEDAGFNCGGLTGLEYHRTDG